MPHLAVLCAECNLICVARECLFDQTLLKNGRDPVLMDPEGFTLLLLASML